MTHQHPLAPPTAAGSTVRDRLWLWGHDAGAHDEGWGLPGPSRISPAEAASYLGVPNLIMVRYGGRPPLPLDRYAGTYVDSTYGAVVVSFAGGSLHAQIVNEPVEDLEPAAYFDSSTIIIGFVLLGRWLEARAKSQAGGAIRELLALEPPTARRLEGNDERDVPLGADARHQKSGRSPEGRNVAVPRVSGVHTVCF